MFALIFSGIRSPKSCFAPCQVRNVSSSCGVRPSLVISSGYSYFNSSSENCTLQQFPVFAALHPDIAGTNAHFIHGFQISFRIWMQPKTCIIESYIFPGYMLQYPAIPGVWDDDNAHHWCNHRNVSVRSTIGEYDINI